MYVVVDKVVLKLIYEVSIIYDRANNSALVDKFENNFIYEHIHLFAYMWDLVDNSVMKLIYRRI